MLYVFRSIAGMGGGGMTNLAMVIVSDVVSLEERGQFILLVALGLLHLGTLLRRCVTSVRIGKWQGILSAGAAAGSAAVSLRETYLPSVLC
jgi:MFS family permease